jgi:hypothetical protein
VFFELDGTAVAEGAVQPGAVVPGDVLHDGPPGGCLGGPGLEVEQLAFDGGEKRFRKGVVPALAGAAQGQRDVALGGEGGEGGRGVLSWQPLSLWKITPGAGPRAARALPNAALTSSVRR